MQHGPERKRLALYHLVIVPGKLHTGILKGFEKEVAVKDERVCLVPCLVQSRPPVVCAIFIFRKVGIVAPHGIVRSDHIGSAHDLHHLHRQRSTIKHVAVQFDIYSVEGLDESGLAREELVLRHLVIWLHVKPGIAGDESQKRRQRNICKYLSHVPAHLKCYTQRHCHRPCERIIDTSLHAH